MPSPYFFGARPVSCNVLTVVSKKGGWFVEQEKSRQGPYPSYDLAVRVAVAEALQYRRNGAQAKVSVQDNDGAVTAELCLCAEFTRATGQLARRSAPATG